MDPRPAAAPALAATRHPYRWVMLAGVWAVYAAFGLVTGSLFGLPAAVLSSTALGMALLATRLPRRPSLPAAPTAG